MSETEQDAVAAALRDLLQSEGWRLLKEQADFEWGPLGMGRRMAEAIEKVPAGPDRSYELAEAAERTYNTAKAVNALIAWPTEALNARTQARRPPTGSVRERMLASLGSRK